MYIFSSNPYLSIEPMTLSLSEAKHIGEARSIENHVWKLLQAFLSCNLTWFVNNP